MRRKVAVLIALAMVLLAVTVFQISRDPEPVDLASAEGTVFSQHGEDGVIQVIFSVIKPTSHHVVEFGCADGVTRSNARNLIVNHGWSALLMDGDHELIAKAKESYRPYPRAKVVEAWVYPGNVEILFDQNGVPKDVDLVSIDIDSNDYYVWNVMHDYRPKVVLIEYNASFPPPQKAVVQFHPLNYWDGQSDYLGASIQSLYELGKKKGYELVYATSAGLNLFFVDAKYFHRFGIKDNSPAALYRPPIYGKAKTGRGPNGMGHLAWDTYEIEKDGQMIKPYTADLTWTEIRIPKRFVSLP